MLPDLPALAASFLALIETVAAENDVTLPDRRYVAPGLGGAEAWDTDQVTVALTAVDPTGSSSQSIAAGMGVGSRTVLPSATLRAEIVRCTPTTDDDGNFLDADVYHQAGLQTLADAALLTAVRGRVPADLAQDRSFRLGQVTPSGPQGGYAGVALLIAVDLL